MLAVTFPILTIWRRQIEIESYELFMKRANEGDPNASDNYKGISKKKKYEQKFLTAWLADPEFKDWIEKRNELPYCKLCECKLSCAKTALKRHKENKKHADLSKIQLQASSSITSLFGTKQICSTN